MLWGIYWEVLYQNIETQVVWPTAGHSMKCQHTVDLQWDQQLQYEPGGSARGEVWQRTDWSTGELEAAVDCRDGAECSCEEKGCVAPPVLVQWIALSGTGTELCDVEK